MGKGNTFSNDLLKLIFNATAIANIADNASASPLANLGVALHTANPGAAGNQTTSEAAYGAYARVAVARSTSGWTASTAQSTSPVANIDFPAATSGTETESYASVGTDTTTLAGKILYSGTVTPSIAVSSGVIPRLTTASTITES
ncbi:MAG TPA: hypothetical protein VFO16_24160 [Pseudonocardiaceae bacterium]|nr:hypothetical protein [Pseudonocardiaceae bacterium]